MLIIFRHQFPILHMTNADALQILAVVVIYFRCCRGKKKEAQPEDVEQAPAIEKGATPHAQRGISRDASKDAAQATRDLPETLEVQPAKEEAGNGKQRGVGCIFFLEEHT